MGAHFMMRPAGLMTLGCYPLTRLPLIEPYRGGLNLMLAVPAGTARTGSEVRVSPSRAGELAFEVSERADNFRGFEGAVPPSDSDLGQDPGRFQSLDAVGVIIAGRSSAP
jgi:hypothetical protein